MKGIVTLGITALLLIMQNVSAETASDGNITIMIDLPEYISQNETFLINLSAEDINVYPVASGYVYLDAVLLNKSMIYFYTSDTWNRTIKAIFNGGVGGIEWYLPSDANYNAGQTVPVKFRAQKVTHTVEFNVTYWPIGYGHGTPLISVSDTVTAVPVLDPSVRVVVSNATAAVFEAVSGKGVDYIRFSEGNQQYITNWDTFGDPAGEYTIKASFSNGYQSETGILLQ